MGLRFGSVRVSAWVWCISMTSTDSVQVVYQLAIHTSA